MRTLICLAALCGLWCAPMALAQEKTRPTTQAQIDYQGFRGLTGEVEAYRAGRLVSLADFQRMAREPGTIILDARSAARFFPSSLTGGILPSGGSTMSEVRRDCAIVDWLRSRPNWLKS